MSANYLIFLGLSSEELVCSVCLGTRTMTGTLLKELFLDQISLILFRKIIGLMTTCTASHTAFFYLQYCHAILVFCN